MRKLTPCLVLLAAACGSSSSSSDTLSGTVGGRSFAVVEARAVQASTGATPCSLPVPGGSGTIDLGVTGLKIDFTSYANVCGDYASGQCQRRAGSQTVSVIFAKLNPLGTPPTLAPGSWPVYSSPATAIPDGDGTGLLTVAYAQVLAPGAAPACDGTPVPVNQGGIVRLDTVTGNTIAGFVDLTFPGGDRVRGPFQAPLCPGVSVDVCDLATRQQFCSDPPVCNP